jgi:hypothetical protein
MRIVNFLKNSKAFKKDTSFFIFVYNEFINVIIYYLLIIKIWDKLFIFSYLFSI